MIKGGDTRGLSTSDKFRIPYNRPTKNYDGKAYYFPQRDADVGNLLARITNVSKGNEYAIEQLILGIKKDHGIKELSELFDGLWVFSAETQANALINWISSSYPMTISGSNFVWDPTFGIRFTVNDTFISTTLTPATCVNFTQYSFSFGCYVTQPSQSLADQNLIQATATNYACSIAKNATYYSIGGNAPQTYGTGNSTKDHGLISIGRNFSPPVGVTSGIIDKTYLYINGNTAAYVTHQIVNPSLGINGFRSGLNLRNTLGAYFVGGGTLNHGALAKRFNEYFFRIGAYQT